MGISFYTFHGLSYVIDIYKGRIKAEKNFVDYALFVSFFPLLVAGPIERATHLLPQIKKPRFFEYSKAVDGLRQILWGLFKKMLIADNCAHLANSIFDHYTDYNGSTLAWGAVLFAFQIYCDFSGYSDIALGAARLFGIDLLRNFAYPYFSRSIAEFWRRWHISLSSWFKDYLYIPLGGSKGSTWQKVRNTFIIFLVSGFWHGANWTFLIWGFLNALYILPSIVIQRNRVHLEIVARDKILPSLREVVQILFTFSLTVIAWIFFRCESVGKALNYLSTVFSKSLFAPPVISEPLLTQIVTVFLLFFITVEWIGRTHQYAIARIFSGNKALSVMWFYLLLILIFLFTGSAQQFIYFQF